MTCYREPEASRKTDVGDVIVFGTTGNVNETAINWELCLVKVSRRSESGNGRLCHSWLKGEDCHFCRFSGQWDRSQCG